jgi:hypothetical protein
LYDSQRKQGFFLKDNFETSLGNNEVLCFLSGTDLILKYYIDELWFKMINIILHSDYVKVNVNNPVNIRYLEISSSHGGEYDVQTCLLVCTAV